MIFDPKAFGAIWWNGHDACAKDRRPFCFLDASFAHLKQPRIDCLLFQLVVYFLGTLSLQNHSREPRRTIPCGKVGDHSFAWQRENVVAFFNRRSVIRKDLAHEYSGVSIVDSNCDFHLIQGQDSGIGLLLITWDEHPGIRDERYWNGETEQQY